MHNYNFFISITTVLPDCNINYKSSLTVSDCMFSGNVTSGNSAWLLKAASETYTRESHESQEERVAFESIAPIFEES